MTYNLQPYCKSWNSFLTLIFNLIVGERGSDNSAYW